MTMNDWTNDGGQPPSTGGFPLGARGVAATAAAAGALIGLLIPMAWIEQLSWQLYLDQLIAAARPPLGVTARLVAVLALAALFGVIGWAAAMLLGVRRNDRLIDSLIAQLRGVQAADEDDAPQLRAADRHPDAPARRPFSATRDIPVAMAGPAGAVDDPMWVEPSRYDSIRDDAGWHDADDDGDELLLDASYDGALAPADLDHDLDHGDASPRDMARTPLMPDLAAVTPADETAPIAGARDAAVAVPDSGYAPSHSVWRMTPVETAVEAPVEAPVEPAVAIHGGAMGEDDQSDDDQSVADVSLAVPVTAMMAAEETAAAVDDPAGMSGDALSDALGDAAADEPLDAAVAPAAPEPLDLSVARLDELIARLEAGLARRTNAPVPMRASADSMDQSGDITIEPGAAAADPGPALARGADATPVNDPMFPQDPALAAALATLRRMNATAG